MHFQLNWRISERGLDDHARVVIYTGALRTAASAPWWGIGDEAAAARVTHLPNPGLKYLPKTQQNFHDQYLHWAASQGIPVAIAFTLLVGWAVVWCWRNYSTWPDPLARALGLAAAAGLTIFLLCNLVDAHFWRIEGGGFFWTLLAFTAARGRTEEEGDRS